VAFWHGVLLRTSPSGWISALMRVRGVLAGWLRLETAGVESGGPFRLLSRTDDVVVAGADDRHLDFRVVLALRGAPDRCARPRAGHGRPAAQPGGPGLLRAGRPVPPPHRARPDAAGGALSLPTAAGRG
jgi:hypothetical protein